MLPQSFEPFVSKVVEYHQFRHELDLSDEEAKAHPDTLEVFGDIVEIVAASPDIVETYRAAADTTHLNHKAAVEQIRTVEMEISLISMDCGVINNRAYQRILRSLLKKIMVVAKANEFLEIFDPLITPPPVATTENILTNEISSPENANIASLDDFLFNTDTLHSAADMQAQLTVHTFYDLVARGVDMDYAIIEPAIRKFIGSLETAEDDKIETAAVPETISAHLQSVDNGLSAFIEQAIPRKAVVLSDMDVKTLQSFYSRANLLLFAREHIIQGKGVLTQEQMEQIYRYRVVVKMLDNAGDMIEQSHENQSPKRAKRWTDNRMRDYGHEVNGRISGDDYNQFCGEYHEPVPPTAKTGDGEIVPLTRLNRHE